MNKRTRKTTLIFIALAILSSAVLGQSDSKIDRNNPFSPSPRISQNGKTVEKRSSKVSITASLIPSRKEPDTEIMLPISGTLETSEDGRVSTASNIDPTSVYRVGIGDVLAITINNAAASSATYTVRSNGTIDFPLAGENVVVVGKTIDQIEASITESVKLYQVPQVSVAIREYVSHGVLVRGMVSVPGYHQLHREAVPLYVVRAGADVSPGAKGVTINRYREQKVESYLLANNNSDNILIYPGDTVEFTGMNEGPNVGYYAIGGSVTTAGQRELADGMTLSKAIATNGGVRGNPKKVIIRRRGQSGIATTSEYEIRALISGKIPDPTLIAGDIIEVIK